MNCFLMLPLLLCLSQSATTALNPQDLAKGQDPTVPAPKYDTGPLRVELLGMAEMRVKMLETIAGGPKESDLRMQFRVQGEGIEKIVRIGNLIFTELVDESGKSLIDENSYTENDKTSLRPVTLPADRLKSGALQIPARLPKVADRKASSLKKVRGGVKVILGGLSEQITVDQPLKFKGKAIDLPRIKEIGVEVQVISAENVASPPTPPDRAFVLQIKTKKENIKSITWFDGSMRPIRPREVQVTLTNNEQASAYIFEPNQLNDELQMTLDIYPTIEEKTLNVAIDDFQLP